MFHSFHYDKTSFVSRRILSISYTILHYFCFLKRFFRRDFAFIENERNVTTELKVHKKFLYRVKCFTMSEASEITVYENLFKAIIFCGRGEVTPLENAPFKNHNNVYLIPVNATSFLSLRLAAGFMLSTCLFEL